jgi:hypothetical protein
MRPALQNMVAPLADASAVTERAAAADYIAALAGDLAAIARRNGLDTLGYVLDMARLEAENASRPVSGRR